MQIKYKNNSLEKICTVAHEADKKYGSRMAELIHQRVDEIDAFPSVEMLLQFKIGRCHPLLGNRKEQYSMDLVHPYRLIFEKCDADIHIVRITEIIDYH